MTQPTGQTTLGTEVDYTVTVTSQHFAGTVALNPAGLPASWTALVDPAQVTLAANGTATATLKVTVPSDTPDLSGTPGVSAYGTPGTETASAPLTVANQYIVTIGDGTGTGDHHLPDRIQVRLGATLRIVDADASTAHRVHSDATADEGFAHQPDDMNAGQEYDVTPTVTGEFRWYCHDHGQGVGVSNLVVE